MFRRTPKTETTCTQVVWQTGGFDSWDHHNLLWRPVPNPKKPSKIPAGKADVEKEWNRLKKASKLGTARKFEAQVSQSSTAFAVLRERCPQRTDPVVQLKRGMLQGAFRSSFKAAFSTALVRDASRRFSNTCHAPSSCEGQCARPVWTPPRPRTGTSGLQAASAFLVVWARDGNAESGARPVLQLLRLRPLLAGDKLEHGGAPFPVVPLRRNLGGSYSQDHHNLLWRPVPGPKVIKHFPQARQLWKKSGTD